MRARQAANAPAHEGAPYLIGFIGGGEEALKIGTAMMSAVIGQVSSVPLGVANFRVADDTPGGTGRQGSAIPVPSISGRQDIALSVSKCWPTTEE